VHRLQSLFPRRDDDVPRVENLSGPVVAAGAPRPAAVAVDAAVVAVDAAEVAVDAANSVQSPVARGAGGVPRLKSLFPRRDGDVPHVETLAGPVVAAAAVAAKGVAESFPPR